MSDWIVCKQIDVGIVFVRIDSPSILNRYFHMGVYRMRQRGRQGVSETAAFGDGWLCFDLHGSGPCRRLPGRIHYSTTIIINHIITHIPTQWVPSCLTMTSTDTLHLSMWHALGVAIPDIQWVQYDIWSLTEHLVPPYTGMRCTLGAPRHTRCISP